MSELLTLNNIYFTIEEKNILNNISLHFSNHERTSIQGKSGSGKSTLLKIMAAIHPISQGSIYLKGKNMKDIDYTDYRKSVSYVYQTPHLFGETVQDNLSFPSSIRDEVFNMEKAQSYLSDLGLDYLSFSQDINSLSGGEKQRVSLIRHLMYPPEMLLLDEVTASLDEESSEKIWQWILAQADRHDISLVWVSHKSEEQEMATRHIVIDQGRLVENGEIDHV
ncbi:MAG: ATP-binding cassette domain-containing protein [Atopococcus tabaci]|uniref:ATP-binding cassette domain-containing protein n=1 Tax=Atopococcus tabaci TaxID=269774 RepID=A0AA43RJU3_9LACT|nr:ATP-binding cassette domain-containing protein [Atopococcus tabaci]